MMFYVPYGSLDRDSRCRALYLEPGKRVLRILSIQQAIRYDINFVRRQLWGKN